MTTVKQAKQTKKWMTASAGINVRGNAHLFTPGGWL